jgi:hypothetical protein
MAATDSRFAFLRLRLAGVWLILDGSVRRRCTNFDSVQKAKGYIIGAVMDEGRKRVIGVMAAMLAARA